MGDYNVPSSGSGDSCHPSNDCYYSTTSNDHGSMFYKNDLHGYSARQFKSSINNIEQVLVNNTDGTTTKQLFALSDRGLYYIDDNDKLKRIKVPLAKFRTGFIDITDDNRLVDVNGARYDYSIDQGNVIYEKSIVDNEGNRSSKLTSYIDKVKYNTVHIDNYDMNCYIITNGSKAYYLYENYNGDRCWQIPMSKKIISLFKNDSVNTTIYGINKVNKKTRLCRFNYSNRQWTNDIVLTGLPDYGTVSIKSFSSFKGVINDPDDDTKTITKYVFIVSTNDSVYYTISDTPNLTIDTATMRTQQEFSLLVSCIKWDENTKQYIDETIASNTSFNYAIYNDLQSLLLIAGSNDIYYIDSSCINYEKIVNDEVTSYKWFLKIKRSGGEAHNYKKLIRDNDIIYTVQENRTSEVISPRQKLDNEIITTDYNDVYYASISNISNIIGINESYSLYSVFTAATGTRHYYRSISTFERYFSTNQVTLNQSLYKIYVNDNTVNIIPTDIQAISKYNKRYDEYWLLDEKYNIMTINSNNKTSVYKSNVGAIGLNSSNNRPKTIEDFDSGIVKPAEYEPGSRLEDEIHTLLNQDIISINQGKRIIAEYKSSIINDELINAIKTIDNNQIVATCCGAFIIKNNVLNDDILIDITGNTNFREMYEINYDLSGDYNGQWFVFTTSDGLINCRAGIPGDPNWNPDWHVFMPGLSFYKIRFSTSPKQFDDVSKKSGVNMVGNFSVKYPSYI